MQTAIKSSHTPQPLEGLNQLRAFAISYVFLYHYKIFGHPEWIKRPFSFGWTGVDLFFVLSGYLISRELFIRIKEGKSIALKTFFIKRFFRIIPPYALVLLLYYALPVVREGQHAGPLWKYLTFTLNFGLDYRQVGFFSHAWSLCVEEQFYLLLPLSILVITRLNAGKRSIYMMAALFIVPVFLRAWEWDTYIRPLVGDDALGAVWHRVIYYPTYNRLDGLLAGVSIAGAFTFYPQTKVYFSRYSRLFLLAGILTCVAAWYICQDESSRLSSIAGYPLIAAGYGMIVAAAVCPTYPFFKVKSSFISWLASLSYAIYLIHKMTIHLTQLGFSQLGIDKNGNLMLLLCMLTAIGGAMLMKIAIERPAMRLRNRILDFYSGQKKASLPSSTPDLSLIKSQS